LPNGGGFSRDEAGSVLSLTGICSVQSRARDSLLQENFSLPQSFRIMLRSPGDIVVIERPSWWSARHSLWVLGFAMAGLALTAGALLLQVRKGNRTAVELRVEMAERRRAEQATREALEQMEYQAHHDSLTGLANRLMFDRSISEALVEAERSGHRVGLLYLDLDQFKKLNDTLGHGAGDVLLEQAAERLRQAAPVTSIVARLGGDEFAVLLRCVGDKSEGEAVAQVLVSALAAPYPIEGSEWKCPASVGVSFYPDDAQSESVLRKNADTALYRAKRTARGQVITFEHLSSEKAQRAVLVETALRRAMEFGGLSLVYQPQFFAGGGLYGFEASMRLRDRALGSVSPVEFIEVAEHAGLIEEVGAWALREACRQWVGWRPHNDSIFMTVNVAHGQLAGKNFAEVVAEALAESGMRADRLELKLDASGIAAHANRTLTHLTDLGVRVSVDESGAGITSIEGALAGVRKAIGTIRIDRAIVRETAGIPGTLPYIRTIVARAKTLGMKTRAEGVETPAQMQALKEAGCDILQGYLLSYPLMVKEADQLVAETMAECETAGVL
jgi:diguanylate cyclase (GGDEF)-like protein